MQQKRTIVLLTDFGTGDSFVGQMKGVILTIAPSAMIIDLSHGISPQNIAQGAFVLEKSLPFFPDGSIFLAIVDPGVGTSRRAIALETPGHLFVGPDNGLFSPVLLRGNVKQCVHITEKAFMLPSRSHTFHGRDLFSPVAAHLASGVPVSSLGSEIDPSECMQNAIPPCRVLDDGSTREGTILFADHFGNLVTSLEAAFAEGPDRWVVETARTGPLPLFLTYADAEEQQPLAYAGSSGTIEIAVRNGSARDRFGLEPGDPVRLKKR